MSDSNSEEVCEAPLTSKDGVCDRTATMPDGHCRYHTELETDMDEDWKPNYQHGLYIDRGGYYKGLPEEDQKWIDAVTDDLIDKSYYGKEDLSMLEKCREIAVDLHQRRRADEYLAQEGLTQTQDVGFHEQYGPLKEEKENVLFITQDRLSRETRMQMKDMGILDDDSSSQTEEAAKSLVESLSEDISSDGQWIPTIII